MASMPLLRQQQAATNERQREFTQLTAGMRQQLRGTDRNESTSSSNHLRGTMAASYSNLGSFGAFEYACRDGSINEVKSTLSTMLFQGLAVAIKAGNIEIAGYLLSAGAPILDGITGMISAAPTDKQLSLFELIYEHGWTPGDDVLLSSFVTNLPVLRWLLERSANPNLGPPRYYPNRPAEMNTCATLEAAAYRGSLEAVRMLLDKGVKVETGRPLHCAAGVCPAGKYIWDRLGLMDEEFDKDRIPVMELLVQHGADVNQELDTPYHEPRYAILWAAMAGAIHRVKWLLEHKADPEVTWARRSAVDLASNKEIKEVLEKVILEQRRVNTTEVTETEITETEVTE